MRKTILLALLLGIIILMYSCKQESSGSRDNIVEVEENNQAESLDIEDINEYIGIQSFPIKDGIDYAIFAETNKRIGSAKIYKAGKKHFGEFWVLEVKCSEELGRETLGNRDYSEGSIKLIDYLMSDFNINFGDENSLDEVRIDACLLPKLWKRTNFELKRNDKEFGGVITLNEGEGFGFYLNILSTSDEVGKLCESQWLSTEFCDLDSPLPSFYLKRELLNLEWHQLSGVEGDILDYNSNLIFSRRKK